MQKILITGAAGRIGQDVTRFLDKAEKLPVTASRY